MFYVQEVDTLCFVTGRSHASRHTILLGVGTAASISCQSKYYSLFTDIKSNRLHAAHNEACFYICLVQYVLKQCHKLQNLFTLFNISESVCAHKYVNGCLMLSSKLGTRPCRSDGFY